MATATPEIIHHMAVLDGIAFPPNSLEAIRTSLNVGAACIEVDITALADGDYLLVHEAMLEAETTGRGAVSACTANEACTLRIRHHDAATDCHVPLLSDIVSLFQQHGGTTRLQLDFKNMIPFAGDEPLQRLIQIIEPLGPRVIVSSGADWQLRQLREIAPWLDLGLDIHFYLGWRADSEDYNGEGYPRTQGEYGYWDDHPIASRKIWRTANYLKNRCGFLMGLVPNVSTFYISHHFLAQSLADGFNWAEELHRHNIKLDAWTMDVTDAAALVHLPLLLQAGVDYITTNTPLALQQHLNSFL